MRAWVWTSTDGVPRLRWRPAWPRCQPQWLVAFHDEHDNGRFDMPWLPWPEPKERGGAANDPEPRLGRPSLGEASFGVGAHPVGLRVRPNTP